MGARLVRQFGNGPLPNWTEAGVFVKKLDHQAKIAGGETFHVGQVVVQIICEPGQDSSAPAFVFLPLRQHAADLPIEHEHAGVAGHRRPHLRGANALLDVGQQRGVVPNGGRRNGLAHGFAHATSDRLSSSRMRFNSFPLGFMRPSRQVVRRAGRGRVAGSRTREFLPGRRRAAGLWDWGFQNSPSAKPSLMISTETVAALPVIACTRARGISPSSTSVRATRMISSR